MKPEVRGQTLLPQVFHSRQAQPRHSTAFERSEPRGFGGLPPRITTKLRSLPFSRKHGKPASDVYGSSSPPPFSFPSTFPFPFRSFCFFLLFFTTHEFH